MIAALSPDNGLIGDGTRRRIVRKGERKDRRCHQEEDREKGRKEGPAMPPRGGS
jgi:hypothetical protein